MENCRYGVRLLLEVLKTRVRLPIMRPSRFIYTLVVKEGVFDAVKKSEEQGDFQIRILPLSQSVNISELGSKERTNPE